MTILASFATTHSCRKDAGYAVRIGIGNPHRRAVAARQQVRAHHVSRRSIGNALAFGDQHETVGVARTRFTESTMTDLDAIRAEIDLTAQRGYVEDREENEQSIWCHGAAFSARTAARWVASASACRCSAATPTRKAAISSRCSRHAERLPRDSARWRRADFTDQTLRSSRCASPARRFNSPQRARNFRHDRTGAYALRAAPTSPSSHAWWPLIMGFGCATARSAAGLPFCVSCVRMRTRPPARSSISHA